MKKIIHVDMDQFFAAVELLDHPELNGLPEWERKSVSCERTFEKDISQNTDVTIHLYHTVLELVRRLEKNDFEGRTLTLKVKFEDFQQITRSITVDHILRTKDDILPLAKQLMHSVEYHSHPIRLIGLGVSNQKGATDQPQPRWIQLELDFEGKSLTQC